MNDIKSAAQVERIEKVLARHRIYALLAKGFRYPEEEAFPQLADGTYAEMLAEAIEVCAPGLADGFDEMLATHLMATSCEELQSVYLSAFETNMPDPSVSLYEGSYHLQNSKPALLLELKSFYRTFGLAIAESENDLEDGLTAELEFMQFLAAKQAQAEETDLEKRPYLRAQRDFLERHLAAWLPALRAEVTAKLKHPFYLALADLAADFVTHDFEQVRRDIAQIGP